MLVKAYGCAVHGIDATIITIEVNQTRGINFHLVGLPDSAVKESQQRVTSAIIVNDYKMPGKKTIINMAPADIRKEGSAYDLPIAMGILAASDQIKPDKLKKYVIMGELSLDGGLQPIKGVLPIAIMARESGFEGLILPEQNAREAAVVNKLKVYGISHINEVVSFFNGKGERKGLFVISEVFLAIFPATEWILVVSRASCRLRGGIIVGIRFANIVFPDPGGPIIMILWPPAAAISSALFTFSCPFTSMKSISETFRLEKNSSLVFTVVGLSSPLPLKNETTSLI